MRRLFHAFFLLSASLHAQDSLITLEPLPDEVRVGQIFNVMWTVQGTQVEVKEPSDFPGFVVEGGPQHRTNTSYRNGVNEQAESYAYSLRVAATGPIALPPFRAKVGDRWVTSSSTPVLSLAEGAPANSPDAMSKALLRAVPPEGTLSADVHADGGYITINEGGDEVVQRFLTDTEARALEKYLRALLDKK